MGAESDVLNKIFPFMGTGGDGRMKALKTFCFPSESTPLTLSLTLSLCLLLFLFTLSIRFLSYTNSATESDLTFAGPLVDWRI